LEFRRVLFRSGIAAEDPVREGVDLVERQLHLHPSLPNFVGYLGRSHRAYLQADFRPLSLSRSCGTRFAIENEESPHTHSRRGWSAAPPLSSTGSAWQR